MFGITYKEMAVLGITYATYTGLLTGVWFVFGREIMQYRNRKRRAAGLKERLAGREKTIWIQTHLENILAAAFAGKVKVRLFWRLSCLCAVIAAVLSIGRYAPGQSVFLAVIAGITPYIVCRVIAEAQRGASGNEAEGFVSTLLSEYRIRGGNILEALEATILQAKELRASRRFLFLLLTGLQNAKNDEMRKEATDAFACALGTNWGRMLAENIHGAVCHGIEIGLSLEDILLQMKETRRLLEERKRLNTESVRMVKMLVPGAYVGSLYLGVKFSGLGWGTILYNQFGTREGFFLFFIILCTFLANTMLIEIVRSKRFDF